MIAAKYKLTLNSQKHPYVTSRASYEVCVVSIWRKIDRVITTPHSIEYIRINMHSSVRAFNCCGLVPIDFTHTGEG